MASGEPRIPKQLHFVWITKNGVEAYPDQRLLVEKTMATVNREMPGWGISLWTNDQSQLPETKDWADSLGIETRNLDELGATFSDYEGLFNVTLQDNVVMASDLARFLILYERGGLYLDFDQVLYEYNTTFLNSFDVLSYTTDQFSFGHLIAETSFIASIPGHPLLETMLA